MDLLNVSLSSLLPINLKYVYSTTSASLFMIIEKWSRLIVTGKQTINHTRVRLVVKF